VAWSSVLQWPSLSDTTVGEPLGLGEDSRSRLGSGSCKAHGRMQEQESSEILNADDPTLFPASAVRLVPRLPLHVERRVSNRDMGSDSAMWLRVFTAKQVIVL
jgi:hypothetical protein